MDLDQSTLFVRFNAGVPYWFEPGGGTSDHTRLNRCGIEYKDKVGVKVWPRELFLFMLIK